MCSLSKRELILDLVGKGQMRERVADQLDLTGTDLMVVQVTPGKSTKVSSSWLDLSTSAKDGSTRAKTNLQPIISPS